MDDDRGNEEEIPDKTTTDAEDGHSEEGKKDEKGIVVAQAADVHRIAYDKPHDPDSEPEDDTTEANLQNLSEQEESSHGVDSNPSFHVVRKDEPEDELEPRSTT